MTSQGKVRVHLVPQELLGRNSARITCEGSGQPPAEVKHHEPKPAAFDQQAWEPETHQLALAYNTMHSQLCSRGIYCSEHQPAYAILEAARRQRDSLRSTISNYSGISEDLIRELGDV